LKKPYLIYFVSLMLIVSCSGAPKNKEQGTGNREQRAESREQAPTELARAEQSGVTELVEVSEQSEVAELVEVSEQDEVTELVELEAVAEEEKPSAEYVESFALDEPEPELQPTEIVMETLRPAGPSLSETPAPPSEPASPVKPSSPASPEQRTTPTLPTNFSPPVRERQPPVPAASPKEEPPNEDTLAMTQGPVVEEPIREERVLLPDYPIMFSRIARVTVGQLVEIPFRGRDGVFLGEVGARRGIAYDSRTMEPEGRRTRGSRFPY
jgi:hypothetical protein